MKAQPKRKPKTIDEYLAAVSADRRAALNKLRKTIRAAAPKAQECISYQIPAFRLNGRFLLAFGAAAKHCSFFPGAFPVEAHKKELKGYDTSKGTIRFPADKPLPAALVRKLVKARVEEYTNRSKKPDRKRVAKAGAMSLANGTPQADPAVVAFLREMDHPLKKEIDAVRRIILGVSPQIREGIKWNSPSFRTTDYFATLNLRARDGKDRVWLILHTGAKAKGKKKEMKIADPAGLLQWLDKNRCLMTFADAKDIQSKRAALRTIVREWIGQL